MRACEDAQQDDVVHGEGEEESEDLVAGPGILDERGQGLAHRVVSDACLHLSLIQLFQGADTRDAPRMPFIPAMSAIPRTTCIEPARHPSSAFPLPALLRSVSPGMRTASNERSIMRNKLSTRELHPSCTRPRHEAVHLAHCCRFRRVSHLSTPETRPTHIYLVRQVLRHLQLVHRAAMRTRSVSSSSAILAEKGSSSSATGFKVTSGSGESSKRARKGGDEPVHHRRLRFYRIPDL